MIARIAGLPAPKWAKWRLMPKVQIWQAAALSLDICPDWIGLVANGLAPEPDSNRRINLALELKERCDIISANGEELEAQKNGEYADHATISLARFITWATRVGLDIPDGLKVIGGSQFDAAPRDLAAEAASTRKDGPERGMSPLRRSKRGKRPEYNWPGVKARLQAYRLENGPIETFEELLQKCADFASELHPKRKTPDDSTIRVAIEAYELDKA